MRTKLVKKNYSRIVGCLNWIVVRLNMLYAIESIISFDWDILYKSKNFLHTIHTFTPHRA